MATKIRPTGRGKSMVIAGIIAAAATGWTGWKASHPVMMPAAIHQGIEKGVVPPAVQIALALIEPWEGLRTRSYLDPIGKPTICIGETIIDGKPVKLGMTMTEAQCRARFRERVIYSYYLPLVDNVKDFALAPDSVQAATVAVAYNAGTGVITRGTSTAGNAIRSHRYDEACRGLTLFNKATIGKKLVVLPGVDRRRTMGDAQRVGEAEVCLNTEVN